MAARPTDLASPSMCSSDTFLPPPSPPCSPGPDTLGRAAVARAPATGCPKDGDSSQRATVGAAEMTESASLLSPLERLGGPPHEHPPFPWSAEAGPC